MSPHASARPTVRLLFVCLGNICRSPIAEGLAREKAAERAAGAGVRIETDSAGTGSWHVGHSPDQRMQATARGHDVDISDLRARRVTPADFHRFDYIFAMDGQNLKDLQAMRPDGSHAKLSLFLEVLPETKRGDAPEVPDPYYGEEDGFEQVYSLVDRAAEALIDNILKDSG
ncbi:MAG: low molecular weight protein-tyrosine-phosphatase [Pseudomonadota bacterium]